jgi:putative hydrolase of the HAD superfamily
MLGLNNEKQICFPDAVLFDTDNTLYEYNSSHKAATKSVIKKATNIFGISESEFKDALEVSRSEVKKKLGNTASSHSRLLYFQKTIEYLGMGTRILTTLDLEQTYWRTFLANSELFPGVKSLLQQLKSKGVKTANITDLTAQIQFRKMVYFGLDEYFDYVVTSEEAGCDKPSPLPFKLALEKLKVKPERVWMIGDDLRSDIYGSGIIGMVKIQKMHNGVEIAKKGAEEEPDITFKNYSEIISLINSLA